MLACHFMLKAFINLSFDSSPVIMKIHSFFFTYRQKKSKSELRCKNMIIMYFALLESKF